MGKAHWMQSKKMENQYQGQGHNVTPGKMGGALKPTDVDPLWGCVICKQTHGSCAQCCKTPSPDSVVVIRTSSRVFAARSLLPNQKECFKGSRLISSKRMELSEPTNSENNGLEPHSTTRCRDYRRASNMMAEKKPVRHRLMGARHHPLDAIASLRTQKEAEDSRVFSSFKERLYHLQVKYNSFRA
ncbi:hypothetical protein Tsubulata_012998 [Turnera subulata]|uniref:Uncharacterized protein n=1 Tax=Turnera subulata TaxID=218843 RepID=A0A9Q0J369_9ROSI|nr:hypothetical protein Tsubulata_012998 [Turnera subulata]